MINHYIHHKITLWWFLMFFPVSVSFQSFARSPMCSDHSAVHCWGLNHRTEAAHRWKSTSHGDFLGDDQWLSTKAWYGLYDQRIFLHSLFTAFIIFHPFSGYRCDLFLAIFHAKDPQLRSRRSIGRDNSRSRRSPAKPSGSLFDSPIVGERITWMIFVFCRGSSLIGDSKGVVGGGAHALWEVARDKHFVSRSPPAQSSQGGGQEYHDISWPFQVLWKTYAWGSLSTLNTSKHYIVTYQHISLL